MTSVSGDVVFDCPHCGNQLYKPFAWAIENDNFPCPVCTGTVTFDPKVILRGDRVARRLDNRIARMLARIPPA